MDFIKQLLENEDVVSEKMLGEELDDILNENKFGDYAQHSTGDLSLEGDLDELFDIAMARLTAGKRAYGIVNRLKDRQQRSEQASRVFANMNRLKSLISIILKKAQMDLSVANDTISRSKFF